MEAEQNINDIAQELARLHLLTGADFSRQVVRIAQHREFHLLAGETSIFSVGGEQGEDYDSLLNAARKAVAHGYKVYILPNPSGVTMSCKFFKAQKRVLTTEHPF